MLNLKNTMIVILSLSLSLFGCDQEDTTDAEVVVQAGSQAGVEAGAEGGQDAGQDDLDLEIGGLEIGGIDITAGNEAGAGSEAGAEEVEAGAEAGQEVEAGIAAGLQA